MPIISVQFGANKVFYTFFLVLLLTTLYNCKNEDVKNSHKAIISDSIKINRDSIQLRVDSVFYDSKNAYFKIQIRNNSIRSYYFPVDFDYSYNFNYKFKKNDALYYSYFYTKYFDKSNNQILGNIGFYDWDTTNKSRKIIDSLNLKDSIYKVKYGVHPNKESMERRLWGIKYHGIKKNGFFLQPQEQMELIVRSHLGNDIRAYASDITYFSSRELKEVVQSCLILHIDSTQIEQDLLLPMDIDSLRKNNILIFHGTLKSNKIPIKFENE